LLGSGETRDEALSWEALLVGVSFFSISTGGASGCCLQKSRLLFTASCSSRHPGATVVSMAYRGQAKAWKKPT
jgi:hypothetical protein